MKLTSDIHIHTNLSSCAMRDATLERYVARAVEDGLETIGIANHVWDNLIPGVSEWYRPQNVEHILQLKQELPENGMMNGVRVLFGCETEFTHESKLCLAEEHMELFDYILVPHSHTHMKVVVPKERIAELPDHASYLMESFLNLVNHPLAHRITSIAHPFVPGTKYELYQAAQALIPDSYFREAFCAAREKGIAIELNGSCLTYMPEEEIPSCEYVRIYTIAKECGCRFTYGSDSHNYKDNRKLPIIEKFLESCGIGDNDFLTLGEMKRG